MSADHDPFERVRERLEGVKPERGGVVALCPAHDDSRPSLRLSRGDDGRALLSCRAGCETEAVVQALGLRMADLMPRNAMPPPMHRPRPTPWPPEGEGFESAEAAVQAYRRSVCRRDGEPLGAEAARWTYTNSAGDTVAFMLRWNNADGTKRDIRPVSRFGARWHLRAPDEGRPLYRMDDLGGGGPVFVTEGEKAADAVASLGVTATTSMGGAKAAAKSCWDSLAGREVFVLPDADDAGAKYAEEVKRLCESLEPRARVFVLPLPALEPGSGEDAVEWIERVHRGDKERARQTLEGLAAAARRPKPPPGGVSLAELAARPDALEPPPTLASGHEHFDSAQPWGAVAMGSLVVVGGEVGAGKSRFLINLALGFARQGSKVAYFLGEMDEGQAWRRAVCATAGVGFKALTSPAPDHRQKLAEARRGFEGMDDLRFVRVGARREALAEWAEWADLLFIDPLHTLADGFDRATEPERLTALMRELVALAADGLTVFASSEIGQGNGDEPELHNAYKGSSAIKQYATALYFVGKPDGGRLQVVRCFKQREGQRVELRARIGPGWQGLAFERAPQEGGAHG